MTAPLVEAREVAVEFGGGRGLFGLGAARPVQAVRDVSLTIAPGETLALVGESGCGKSTLGRALIRVAPIARGRVLFDGRDVTDLSGEALRRARADFQMIFQDPYASLNPRMRIGAAVAEPLRAHRGLGAREAAGLAAEALTAVGLDPSFAERFPHELSGGQRQRVAIARAMVLRPRFVFADEPLSALDVSLQLQILKLFDDLRRRFALTCLFVSHDLARVLGFAERVAVMYLGRIVEIGPSAEIVRRPAHPYTRALIAAAPTPDPVAERARPAPPAPGEPPSPAAPPPGCAFHPRCPSATALCREAAPPLRALGAGREVACHHPAAEPAVPSLV